MITAQEIATGEVGREASPASRRACPRSIRADIPCQRAVPNRSEEEGTSTRCVHIVVHPACMIGAPLQ